MLASSDRDAGQNSRHFPISNIDEYDSLASLSIITLQYDSSLALQHHPPHHSQATLQHNSPASLSSLTLHITLQPHSPASLSRLTLQSHSPASFSVLTLQPHSPASLSTSLSSISETPFSLLHIVIIIIIIIYFIVIIIIIIISETPVNSRI
ncbi:unnamed protein product [Gadus morhua 'NCC']